MDFEKIVLLFTMQEPYYGILLSSMQRIPTDKVPTLCIAQSGNAFKLYYNPSFTSRFDVETVKQLCKHEVLHMAFNHFTIWDGQEKDDTPEVKFLRNIACDLEINCYLDRRKMQKEAGGVWVEDYGWPKSLGSREYFNRLVQKSLEEQQQQAQQPQTPCNGGSEESEEQSEENPQDSQKNNTSESSSQTGGIQAPTEDGEFPGKPGQIPSLEKLQQEYNQFDDHSKWPDDMDENEAENLKQAIDDLLVFAAEECEKSCGEIPSELKFKIEGLRNQKKPRPIADWKRYFRRYLGHEFTEFIRKSKKRESRRFPDAAGNRHRRKSNILVGIDTSGSVSMPEYLEFFGQLKTLSTSANFHVVECDTVIQYEYDYKNKPNDDLHGGGGTSFLPVVNMFNENRRKYDALVYFTDGYANIPRETPRDTLWVISSQGDQDDRKKYRVNGASVVFIPKKAN